MPTFSYAARDQRGRSIQGEIDAASQTNAARSLRSDGVFIVSLRPVGRVAPRGKLRWRDSGAASDSPGRKSTLLAPKLDKNDVCSFAHQMAIMLETGVPLSEAMEMCMDAKNSPAFAAALKDVSEQINAGTAFSAALARHPRVFSPLFINMIRASEASGQIGHMLRRVADFLTRQRELTRRVKGAMAYPLVMIALSIGVVGFLMSFVLPRFAKIYAGKEHVLPQITRFMMALGDSVTHYGPYVGAGLLLASVAAVVYLRRPEGRRLTDRVKLALPLFGPLIRKAALARSLRVLGTLIQAGVAILESVELTRSAVGNIVYAEMWGHVHDMLRHGSQISEAIRPGPLVPRAVCKMIEAGERSGRVGPVMDRVATHCEEELATDIKTLTGLVEPAIVIVLGVVVGVVVISMLLPIFTLSKAIGPGH